MNGICWDQFEIGQWTLNLLALASMDIADHGYFGLLPINLRQSLGVFNMADPGVAEFICLTRKNCGVLAKNKYFQAKSPAIAGKFTTLIAASQN